MSNPNTTAMRTMNLVGAHALESVLLVLVEAASPHSTHANEDKASHNRADGAGLEWQFFEHSVVTCNKRRGWQVGERGIKHYHHENVQPTRRKQSL